MHASQSFSSSCLLIHEMNNLRISVHAVWIMLIRLLNPLSRWPVPCIRHPNPRTSIHRSITALNVGKHLPLSITPLVDRSRFSLRLTFRLRNLRLIPVNKYLIVYNPRQVSVIDRFRSISWSIVSRTCSYFISSLRAWMLDFALWRSTSEEASRIDGISVHLFAECPEIRVCLVHSSISVMNIFNFPDFNVTAGPSDGCPKSRQTVD